MNLNKIINYLRNKKHVLVMWNNNQKMIKKHKKNAEIHQKNAIKRGSGCNSKNKKHIAFLITEFEQIVNAGDKYAAIGIGTWLAKRFNFNVSYYTKIPEYEWGNVDRNIDYVICMTPEPDISYLKKHNKTIIAWVRGNTQNWIKYCNMKSFDGVITSSNILQEYFQEKFTMRNLLGVVNLAVPIDIQKKLKNINIDYKNRELDVSFVGNLKGQDRPIVENLQINDNFNFNFYGTMDDDHPWKKFSHGSIEHSRLIDVYLNSKIVIEDIAIANKGTANLRIFEASACGALVIANDDDALFELFDKKEVIVYKNKKDLNEKISYYLSHDKERIELAKSMCNKVLTKYIFKEETQKFVQCINKLEANEK